MAQDMAPDVQQRRFELTSFLEGPTRAWGIFEDRFGRLRRRFEVEMHGRWSDGIFLLEERFIYDTGEREERVWRVVPEADGRFTATCPDCIGSAAGVSDESSVRMRYRFRLKLQSRELTVDFVDRIYLMGDRTAVNRATMSKWGVKLGELSLFFERAPKGAARVSAN